MSIILEALQRSNGADAETRAFVRDRFIVSLQMMNDLEFAEELLMLAAGMPEILQDCMKAAAYRIQARHFQKAA